MNQEEFAGGTDKPSESVEISEQIDNLRRLIAISIDLLGQELEVLVNPDIYRKEPVSSLAGIFNWLAQAAEMIIVLNESEVDSSRILVAQKVNEKLYDRVVAYMRDYPRKLKIPEPLENRNVILN